MAEKKMGEGVECETCAPIGYIDTWRCAECGAMNINKWTECWKCKTPRLPGPEKTGTEKTEGRE